MIGEKIAELLEERGPMTGGELYEATRIDRFELWRECVAAPGSGLLARSMGRRYMRLDERLPGYARLSPSILREFLTYSAIGLESQAAALASRLDGMASRMAAVTERKKEVGRAVARRVMESAGGSATDCAAFVISGDIAYGMAHEEPRPERSTGRIVRGSDIDIVVLLSDSSPDAAITALDEAMHREKYAVLTNPLFREEIDYVVKRLSRVREQLAFDTFKRMVACKILDEGLLLAGDVGIFGEMKGLLSASGVSSRLSSLREDAEAQRSEAVALLSGASGMAPGDGLARLFYSADESEEFE